MAFIPVPNTAQVEIRMTLVSQQIENVIYFDFGGPISTADLQVLADAVSDWWNASYRPLIGSYVIGREVYCTDLTTQSGPFAVDLQIGGVVGALAVTQSVPNNVAPCISFRTAQRGRSGRGRNYLPPPAPAQVFPINTLTPAYQTAWRDAYELLITAPPAGWTWCVVSRFNNGAPRNPGIAIPIDSVGFTDATVDSQRRRLPGRGS